MPRERLKRPFLHSRLHHDARLVEVDRLSRDLLGWLDKTRMPRKALAGERVLVYAEHHPDGAARLLARNAGGLVHRGSEEARSERLDLVGGKESLEEEVSLPLKRRELFIRQLDDIPPVQEAASAPRCIHHDRLARAGSRA